MVAVPPGSFRISNANPPNRVGWWLVGPSVTTRTALPTRRHWVVGAVDPTDVLGGHRGFERVALQGDRRPGTAALVCLGGSVVLQNAESSGCRPSLTAASFRNSMYRDSTSFFWTTPLGA
jgi:hypothetical protein